MISVFYLSLLVFIYLALTFYVISIRRSKLISLGDGGHAPLTKAVRAHGNFIEFTPLFIIMLYFLEQQSFSATFLHILSICFVIGRISHAIAIIKSHLPLVFRIGGMLLTLGVYIVAAGVLFYKNLPQLF